ncbi:MAG: hypothetical protein IJQ50_03685 [Clostridia bacterium]|nr:hypothetical protein [Clostridia bacterium]
MNLYSKLRKKYPAFSYNNFEITEDGENCIITYNFEIENLCSFHPVWTFKKGTSSLIDDAAFKKLVFNLGMVELVSYWKLTCSPNVKIKCGYLDNNQIDWWKKLYYNGLGECFYTNNIEDNINDFMAITSLSEETFDYPVKINNSKCLIPIGGGKDSVVTLGILEKNRDNNFCYIINPRGATSDTVKKSGYGEKTIIALRTLDPEMLRLTTEGFINGHTPFSALVAFSSLIACYINKIKYIALSNESSANESSVMGSYVNHQYSKSFEFERDFFDYEQNYIKSGIYYFSLLRPLSEYQIAKEFSKRTAFYKIFKSCNVGSKRDIWCGECSKCLFVFIILSPFISPEKLSEIFDGNLFEKNHLLEIFKKLIGIIPEKPFECVGSRDEINFALCEAIKKYEVLPPLLKYYISTPLYKKYSNSNNPYNNFYDKTNLIPAKFEKLLKESINRGI